MKNQEYSLLDGTIIDKKQGARMAMDGTHILDYDWRQEVFEKSIERNFDQLNQSNINEFNTTRILMDSQDEDEDAERDILEQISEETEVDYNNRLMQHAEDLLYNLGSKNVSDIEKSLYIKRFVAISKSIEERFPRGVVLTRRTPYPIFPVKMYQN